MSHLCLDRHVANGLGDQTAIIYDSPVTGVVEHISYATLLDQVARFAAGMRNLKVGFGDRVIIYMPMIPQAVVAMLACARLGAIHSVVFGGFAPHELAMRIDDAQPKLIISSSYGIEFGKKIPYKVLVEEALTEARHKPDFQIYFRREEGFDSLAGQRDMDYEAMFQCGRAGCVQVPATHPLYILYTSGTTGRPKGIVRDTGGYAVALNSSMEYFYGIHPGEVTFTASDIGWVVGHSYIVYGPLLRGCTTVLFEGKPVRTPDAGVFWRIIQEHRVNHMFTAPTAIRAIRKEDANGALLSQYDISSLRHMFVAGERCDTATYDWISQLIQRPVIDHWWQTESGWPMLGLPATVPDMQPRPGSAGKPVYGYDIRIIDENGEELPAGQEGYIVVKLPLPPGCLPSLWRNEIRFQKSYFEKFPGFYLTGDGGYRDAEGYYFVMGRIDDVINVSGHRLSTGEMEEIVAAHPAIAECAVIGIADELRGQRPIALVVLKDGVAPVPEAKLEESLVQLIRGKVGPVAFFKNAVVVKRLPKTRSGKILRKTMCQIANGEHFSIPSTIDDSSILSEISTVLARRRLGIAFQ
jgi:propionyl-CoA synthetase